MRKYALVTLAALGLAGTANAAVLTLESVANNGPNDFTFQYQATLGPDEGVKTGDRLVIFDFNGYIANSIFSASPTWTATAENVTAGAIITPGTNDNAAVTNLVFTYNGPNFRTGSGPLAPFNFPFIGARSTLGGTTLDAFYALTTKNNPATERGRNVYTLGFVSVPTVPEPDSWALMLGGFGMLGFMARRRSGVTRVAA